MRLAVCAPQADLLSPIIGLVNNELSSMQAGDMNIHQSYAVVISEIDHLVKGYRQVPGDMWYKANCSFSKILTHPAGTERARDTTAK